MRECEWEHDEDTPAFVSVYTTGLCGGDSSWVCAEHFLAEVNPQQESWELDNRLVQDDTEDISDPVVVLADDRRVRISEAVEIAKQEIETQVVEHA